MSSFDFSTMIRAMTQKEKYQFAELWTPRLSRYLPKDFKLSPKQTMFLIMRQQDKYAQVREFFLNLGKVHGVDVSYWEKNPTIKTHALFGGAAYSGKTVVLSALALTIVTEYEYNCRCFTSEKQQGESFISSIGSVVLEYLLDAIASKKVHYSKAKGIVTFPNQNKLQFGGLENASAYHKYKGASVECLIFDEITNIHPDAFIGIMDWCRNNPKAENEGWIPSESAATNPNGKYTEFYKKFFVTEPNEDTMFLPSLPQDNPFINFERYKRTVMSTGDQVKIQQNLYGRWDIVQNGILFKRENFIEADEVPDNFKYLFRGWDIAATKEVKSNYTVGVKIGYVNGEYYILDVERFKGDPSEVNRILRETAIADTRLCDVAYEEQSAAAGKWVEDTFKKEVFAGFNATSVRVMRGDKSARARPLSIAVGNKLVKIVKWCRFKEELINEMCAFPNGEFDDILDACALAFNVIQEKVAKNTSGTPVSFGSSEETTSGDTKNLGLPVMQISESFGQFGESKWYR